MKETEFMESKCMLTLAFILILIFSVESERLNHMPTAYLKLQAKRNLDEEC